MVVELLDQLHADNFLWFVQRSDSCRVHFLLLLLVENDSIGDVTEFLNHPPVTSYVVFLVLGNRLLLQSAAHVH